MLIWRGFNLAVPFTLPCFLSPPLALLRSLPCSYYPSLCICAILLLSCKHVSIAMSSTQNKLVYIAFSLSLCPSLSLALSLSLSSLIIPSHFPAWSGFLFGHILQEHLTQLCRRSTCSQSDIAPSSGECMHNQRLAEHQSPARLILSQRRGSKRN